MQSNQMEQLIRQAKARDANAFTELMQLYMQDMYKVAYSILMNDEDVADAIQDTILTCWEKLSSLKKNRCFKTWIIRVLINHCYDIVRKNAPLTCLEEWQEPITYDRYNVEWKEALSSVSEKYRVVLLLFYSEGYHIREISKMLKRPASTIRTQLERGRKQVEKYYCYEERSL